MRFLISTIFCFCFLHCLQAQRCDTYNYLQKSLTTNSRISSHASVMGEFEPGKKIVIPVVIHLLYNTATQNISDAQILSQLQSLNKDFRKLNGDTVNIPAAFAGLSADAGITFCLAKQDAKGKPTTGIVRKFTSLPHFMTDDAMKFSASGGDDAWDTKKYLNIWVCNLFGRSLGYATLPGSAADKDGLVIKYDAFGTMGTLTAPFNKGRTATHEIGHWLGLQHLWGDANCGTDGIDDTPPQQSYNNGCPAFPHKTLCSINNNGDMFMNFMDFTDDACMNMFTHGQKNKMRSQFAQGGARNSFLNSSTCDSVGIQQGSLPEDIAAKTMINIYPNPVSSILNIDFSNGSIREKKLQIFNAFGREIITVVFTSQKKSIPVNHLPAGVYFLQINNGKEKKVLKFLKL